MNESHERSCPRYAAPVSDETGTLLVHLDAERPHLELRGFHLDTIADRTASHAFTALRVAIGSHPSNDLVLDDPTVSRFHCELRLDPRGVRVRDQGSSNGTFVDRVRVVDGYLHDGAELRVGARAFVLRLDATPRSVPLGDVERFGALVGRSAAMRQAFEQLARCAKSDATVLLDGETGTGKEAAAIAIHEASARTDGPFVVVDCGALPATLLESELFGHVRGAFTGADRDHVGAFEAAHGGTIFLDEIGELPLDLQPKLLRALEQRTIRRVGDTRHRAIDVRVIAATHRNLRTMVNEGQLRPDLYYRLAVVSVELPPLRDRLDDLPLLVGTLLDRLRADPSTRARFTSVGFLAQLHRSRWPGNVRELRNYLERSLVLDAPAPIESAPAAATDSSTASAGSAADFPLDPTATYADARTAALAVFERRWLEALLAHHGGNVSEAARSAEINRPYLHKLLRRHGLR